MWNKVQQAWELELLAAGSTLLSSDPSIDPISGQLE
jgi:hypothetical protein